MRPATTKTMLRVTAEALGLHVAFSETANTVSFLRPAELRVQVLERTPDGWREKTGTSKGLELLAELPTIRRAWAWLRGYRIRLQQRREAS